jgi:hypothetical protein
VAGLPAEKSRMSDGELEFEKIHHLSPENTRYLTRLVGEGRLKTWLRGVRVYQGSRPLEASPGVHWIIDRHECCTR